MPRSKKREPTSLHCSEETEKLLRRELTEVYAQSGILPSLSAINAALVREGAALRESRRKVKP